MESRKTRECKGLLHSHSPNSNTHLVPKRHRNVRHQLTKARTILWLVCEDAVEELDVDRQIGRRVVGKIESVEVGHGEGFFFVSGARREMQGAEYVEQEQMSAMIEYVC